MKLVFAAHHQRRLVGCCHGPLAGQRRAQVEARALPVVKAPFAEHNAGQLAIRGQIAIQQGRSRMLQHQPTLRRIGLQRQIYRAAVIFLAGFVHNMQGEAVGELCGKNQRRSLGRQHQARFLGAIALRRVHRMQRRRPGNAHRRQRHHHHRFGILKRRRHAQPQVQRILGRQSQGGNVLKMRRVQRREDLGRVHDGADIRAVCAPACHARVAKLVHQVHA